MRIQEMFIFSFVRTEGQERENNACEKNARENL